MPQIPWTCAICKSECAPCWSGYTTEDHKDICGVCGFMALSKLKDVKVITIDDPKRKHTEGEAMRLAAGTTVDFMPLTAVLQLSPHARWQVVCIERKYFFAQLSGRLECRDGHVGGFSAGKRRCTSCGEVAPAP